MATLLKLPKRESLVSNVTELLLGEIRDGVWTTWLPDERTLSRRLQVSRNTVRAALQRLERKRLIETIHGRGRRIATTARTGSPSPATSSVGVLIAKELHGERHFTSLFIDEIRGLLNDAGFDMYLYSGRQFARSQPARALERLIERVPHHCWLLCSGLNNGSQRWFENRGIKTLISGIRDSQVSLPAVSVDNDTLGSKAASLILNAGHRRILATTPGASNDGISESVNRFQKAHGASVEMRFLPYDADTDAFHRMLDRTLKCKRPATAIFANESHHYLQIVSYCAQRGIRIPEDLSLVCRDSESYLEYLLPEPTRFKKSPIVYGNLLVDRIIKLLKDEPVQPPHTLIVPTLVRGASLGPPS